MAKDGYRHLPTVRLGCFTSYDPAVWIQREKRAVLAARSAAASSAASTAVLLLYVYVGLKFLHQADDKPKILKGESFF